MEVGDWIVDGDEPLEVSGGFEPLHDPLSPPRQQVRILCPVVEALVLAMLEIHAHPGPGRAIGTELVGDHHPWRAGLLSYQLAQELLCCAPIPAALDQSVQNEAVSIDGAPQPMLLAVDRDHDLVEMPLVAELRRAPTDLAGVDPSEFLRPAPHGFMADDDPARREQVLDHPQAERKTELETDSLLDDFRREPIAAINGFRCRHHRAQIADVRRHFVNLTVPSYDSEHAAQAGRKGGLARTNGAEE